MRLIPNDGKLGWTPYMWTIYICFLYIQPVLQPHTSLLEWSATVGLTLMFFALYFRGYWLRGRAMTPIIGGLIVLGLIVYPYNVGGACFFIYAGAFAGRLDNSRRAATAIAIIEILCIAETLLANISLFNAFWPLLFTIIVGATNIHFEQVHRSQAKLRLAQDEIEHLAKVAERERIA